MRHKIFKTESNALFRILFLFVFWGMWFVFPLLIIMNNPEVGKWVIKMLPINISMIPLFFINTELLVKKILPSKGVGYYVISLIILLFSFLLFHMLTKYFFMDLPLFAWGEFIRTFFPVLTVGAVSTGYGLINYVMGQQKLQEEENEQRKQSELSFLRSQISPHFIFNALNTIVYLIRSKAPEAEDVTIKLSEIMQYTLYNAKDTVVPLDKEIAYLKNYIELQKIRFGEDVEIIYEQSGDPDQIFLEPMLIIPFVENAFKHGTGIVTDPYVHIKIEIFDKILTLKVSNKYHKSQDSHSDKSGIGLKNVSRRLEILYPGSHELVIDDTNDTFAVHLKLKLH